MYKFNYFNRPITPHLVIYQLEWSSLSSIWHRISGIFLLISLFSFIYINKLLTNPIFLCLYISIKILPIFLICQLILIYHIINGFKYIFWIFNYLFNLKLLKFLMKVLFFFLILYIIISFSYVF